MDYTQLIISPVSNDEECGSNLEDDASFQNFFFEAAGTPERYDGQTTIPAEPPEWRNVKKQALTYFDQTRDIKLISILTQSVLNTEGLNKFEECLSGLSQLIQTQWKTVNPPLDEDDGDPLERISALGHIIDKTFVVDILKHTAIADSKVLGKVTLSAIENADSGDGAMTMSQIKGILGDTDNDEILSKLTAISHSIDHLNQINQTFIENAGNDYNVNFDAVTEVLTHLVGMIEKHANITLNNPVTVEDSQEATDNSAPQPTANQATASTGAPQMVSNINELTLTSREDVEKCFSLICNYYSTFEPSSPIPVIVNRANKLVHMDFLDIVKEIMPDALDRIIQLGGIDPNQLNPTETNEQYTTQQKTDDTW